MTATAWSMITIKNSIRILTFVTNSTPVIKAATAQSASGPTRLTLNGAFLTVTSAAAAWSVIVAELVTKAAARRIITPLKRAAFYQTAIMRILFVTKTPMRIL